MNKIRAETNASPVNKNPINIVAVGYDIGNNIKAQDMLNEMAQAARDSGVSGEVILADKDSDQLDLAMQQAISFALRPAATAVRLELKNREYRPGETIVVNHSDFPIENQHAWIAFYEKADDRDQDYLHYTFLINLTDRVFDVVAPHKPGDEYHFRIFLTEDYDAAARSESIEVR